MKKSSRKKTPAPLTPLLALGGGEIIFADASSTSLRLRKKALKEGTLREVTSKVYTTNLTDSLESIVKRNWKTILGHMYPGAVISYRTAFELKPSQQNHIFLTYSYTKKKPLPGLTVNLIKGSEKNEDDIQIPGGLYLSSDARKALENLEPAHAETQRVISQEELEKWLEGLLNARGEAGLNIIRDRAKELAVTRWKKEEAKLNGIISALLKTRPSDILVSDAAIKRAHNLPYDTGRDQLFDHLFVELTKTIYPVRPNLFIEPTHRQAFAFFESYFSNFIEGTEFEVEEAKEIVFDGKIPTGRPKDGHDILGTYTLANQVLAVPQNVENLIHLLKSRHHIMLANRPEAMPGEFKQKRNRAGETHFVEPDLVKGTLYKGFEYYKALPAGFARAAFMMFLIAEIHPFADGNGRIARIMMNVELSEQSLARILIPIVYREDYLLALKKLTRQGQADAYIKMLSKAHQFTASLKPTTTTELEQQLTVCNAFKEPEGNRLIIPNRG
ncbi:MAG: Fic family protein [Pseudobdellovibrio sp.]|nr:Fic family protein [Pseudobdellovibrio sp.]